MYVETLIEDMTKEIMKLVEDKMRQKGLKFKKSIITDTAKEVIQKRLEFYKQKRNIYHLGTYGQLCENIKKALKIALKLELAY